MERRRIYLVRHGRTSWNDVFRYQGRSDVPLSPEGEEQGRRMALRFRSAPPERVVSSSLSRARRTAELLCEALPSPPPLDILEDLAEMDFGEFEGRTVPELEEENGALYRRWRENPLSVTPPGGESVERMVGRADRVVSALRATEAERVAVVGHGFFFRVLIARLLGGSPSDALFRIRLDNASVSAIDFWRDYPPFLLFLNDSLHLGLSPSLIPELRWPD